jgi:hypothetical protein
MSNAFRCNYCNEAIVGGEIRYRCQICRGFDLCKNCYCTIGHYHTMDKIGRGNLFANLIVQLKPHNVSPLGQNKTDNINLMITLKSFGRNEKVKIWHNLNGIFINDVGLLDRLYNSKLFFYNKFKFFKNLN